MCCVCACTHMRAHICSCVCVHVRVYSHVCLCLLGYVHVCAHICVHICVHVCASMHPCVLAHAHVCVMCVCLSLCEYSCVCVCIQAYYGAGVEVRGQAPFSTLTRTFSTASVFTPSQLPSPLPPCHKNSRITGMCFRTWHHVRTGNLTHTFMFCTTSDLPTKSSLQHPNMVFV